MNFSDLNQKISTAIDLSVLRCFENVQIDGEPDIIVELIDLYLDDVPRRFALMRSAISGKDQSAIKQQAHTLKASSGNLGAQGMVLICDRMERLEFNGPTSGLPLLMDQVEQEFSRVQVALLEERQRRLR